MSLPQYCYFRRKYTALRTANRGAFFDKYNQIYIKHINRLQEHYRVSIFCRCTADASNTYKAISSVRDFLLCSVK